MTSFITGIITVFVTFPGVILRQVLVQFFCFYFKIPVFKTVYFQVYPPGGFVLRETAQSPWTELAIIVGPSIVCTVVGMVIGFSAVVNFWTADLSGILGLPIAFLDLALIWLAISLTVHSFPTLRDAKTLSDALSAQRHPKWVQALGVSLAGAATMLAFAAIFWLDFIYAVVLVIVLPVMLIEVVRAAS